MLTNKVVIYLLTFLLLTSCEFGVVFSESNPPGLPLVQSIPEQFHGVFLCQSDSSYIRISDYDILHEEYYSIIMSISEVEESEHCSIVDGGLFISEMAVCVPFKYISEDSISADISTVDTLYSFQEGEEMKSYKGRLFLNTATSKGDWDTWVLHATEFGALQFSKISIPAEETIIQSLSEDYSTRTISDNRIQYILRPKLVEFDEILNQNYIERCKTLIPLNIEAYEFFNYEIMNE